PGRAGMVATGPANGALVRNFRGQAAARPSVVRSVGAGRRGFAAGEQAGRTAVARRPAARLAAPLRSGAGGRNGTWPARNAADARRRRGAMVWAARRRSRGLGRGRSLATPVAGAAAGR